nr:hypothetical protein BgiMline_027591 [Biomphalaria glabrata]
MPGTLTFNRDLQAEFPLIKKAKAIDYCSRVLKAITYVGQKHNPFHGLLSDVQVSSYQELTRSGRRCPHMLHLDYQETPCWNGSLF